jgi:glycosyltransferase involved in cell wall biosynthesis
VSRGGSVVIPAHDEAAVIGRCLDSIASAVAEHDLEVVVVCNGCTDNTAAVARTYSGVRVEEILVPSKVAALRAGDKRATSFPRVYLDADVVLPAESLAALVTTLRHDGPLASRPTVSYDTARATWPVRRYYLTRTRIPQLTTALWGAGVYALSHDGRSRFGEFPEATADDLFVDLQFAREEMQIVAGPPVVVRPPQRLSSLVGTLRRTYRGKNEQLTGPTAERVRSGTRSVTRELGRLARQGPVEALDVGVYVGIVLVARVALRLSAPVTGWERDRSSRD